MPRLTRSHARLRELAELQPQPTLEDTTARLTGILADLLEVRRVSLMLLDVGAAGKPRLRLSALHGELPAVAWQQENALGEGIAGRVLALGESVNVADLAASEWAPWRRRADGAGAFLACPVPVAGAPAGVLNFSEPIGRTRFSRTDQGLAELAASLTGRALQLARLDRLLDSRFAQLALAAEGGQNACSLVTLSAHEPERVAGMLARAFYREMRQCGFSPNQIIHAAGEIISELTRGLNRHKQRAHRGGAGEGA